MNNIYNSHFLPALTLVLLVTLTLIGYSIGIGGPFLLDDFHNLGPIAIDGGVDSLGAVLRYMFAWDGLEFSRPVARLSFLIDDQYWPAPAYEFKKTNIAIHLINGLLIAFLCFQLLRRVMVQSKALWVSILCCGLWLVNPLQVSTTLYVVQRMTQLMLLFMLASLICYVFFRSSSRPINKILWLCLAGIFALLSFLSKENAAIILMLYFCVDYSFFYRKNNRVDVRHLFFSACLMAVFLIAYFWMLYITVSADTYQGRDFTLLQRVLIQGEMLYQYIYFWLGLGADQLTLFHDDVEWKIKNIGIGLAWVYWLLHAAVVFLAIRFFKSHPIITFGVAWFYIGHMVESSFIPLELMYEHRNYMPSMGLALIAAYSFMLLFDWLKERNLIVLGIGLPVLFLSILMIGLVHRASIWSDYRMLSSKWAAEHPNSLRAQDSFISMLEVNGMELMALNKLNEVYPRFNEAALLIHRVVLECKVFQSDSEELSSFRIDDFVKMNFTSGVNFYLKDMTDSPNRKCIDDAIAGGDLIDLMAAAENMPLLRSKSKYYAQYLDIASGFYISEKEYAKAVIAREKLWEVQPTIDTALKLAELFLMGGDRDQARTKIAWAKVQDEARWYANKKVTNAIYYLEQSLLFLEQQ